MPTRGETVGATQGKLRLREKPNSVARSLTSGFKLTLAAQQCGEGQNAGWDQINKRIGGCRSGGSGAHEIELGNRVEWAEITEQTVQDFEGFAGPAPNRRCK
jgi:hypothetical protein